MENTIKMDDLGVPLFLETTISIKKPILFGVTSPCRVREAAKNEPCSAFMRTPVSWLTWSHNLPETNIAPKNGCLEYYFPIGDAYFQGLCHVSFRESYIRVSNNIQHTG